VSEWLLRLVATNKEQSKGHDLKSWLPGFIESRKWKSNLKKNNNNNKEKKNKKKGQ